ncbi:PLD nuclease N-terminal domain-containing protein [Kineosporia rhizophila]|uniref:PLD nuclease N-terminal domain-containing protein n=1 Tax=Kineosporia TaxID=49184 RepID=UPI001E49A50E|nr:PLD nuclease N-terminal domain-containing protein [Kineosporia sp. NBRC 101677]MCE0540213.1 PLD nuclease N-terminal domain-containing protein [Kineosporia rhizophila]GLY17236.1 membrane protein [Kineosporia sp. NBRC 101677]
MIRFLPVLIQLGLLIYCLIDCIQTDSALVRNLPKLGWILLILFFPFVGGIAWLVAGRPKQSPGRPASGRPGPASGFPEAERPQRSRPDTSDIDDRLRQDQERIDREYDEALRKWEENKRRRDSGNPEADPS